MRWIVCERCLPTCTLSLHSAHDSVTCRTCLIWKSKSVSSFAFILLFVGVLSETPGSGQVFLTYFPPLVLLFQVLHLSLIFFKLIVWWETGGHSLPSDRGYPSFRTLLIVNSALFVQGEFTAFRVFASCSVIYRKMHWCSMMSLFTRTLISPTTRYSWGQRWDVRQVSEKSFSSWECWQQVQMGTMGVRVLVGAKQDRVPGVTPVFLLVPLVTATLRFHLQPCH